MRLTRLPSFGAAMVTMSSLLCVKPCPGVSRSWIGANYILNGSVTDHDHGRAGLIWPPDPPGEARLSGVIGQGGSDLG
jgi:hypothetical protein